jgi:hypothetical protein
MGKNIFREVGSAAMVPWEVIPAPHGQFYPWRESGETEWQCVLVIKVTRGENFIFCERPRSPMAARGAIHAGRGTSPSMERDAGSHSVDRIVRVFCLLTDPAPAGKDFVKGSDSDDL